MFQWNLRRAAAAMLVAMIALATTGDLLAQGCSMCGSSLQENGDPLAQSISRSVILMASMPFALFATVAGWLAWKLRARAHDASGEDKGRSEGTDA